ncbi:unnamed protein product [Nippostrongylus brasiliensis]|uniref:Multiple C2 and transmembrane domain-containing protein 1-like n=1 Tax=Nippostrongylus brasiliensis TaxID=27835 RepID=A0A0N4YSD1_NIPBR|nr:unnamed protein product [Nippostrongylus brasiliensis]
MSMRIKSLLSRSLDKQPLMAEDDGDQDDVQIRSRKENGGSVKSAPGRHSYAALPSDLNEKEKEDDLNYVSLLVKIRLKEGHNLAIRDASGSSDPYVKFRYKDRIVYKSSTKFKNLNPIWDEEFQMLADDMTSPIYVEVFDYDRFCTDDFMGSSTIDISQVKWFQQLELVVKLADDASPDEELGTVSFTISVVPLTNDEKDEFEQRSVRGVLSEVVRKREKCKYFPFVQNWVAVVNVVLVEGRNLNLNYNSTIPPDVYCKFKLGCEKYKSKVKIDLHQFPRDQTIEKWYSLDESTSALLLLITVSGSQSKDSVVELTDADQDQQRNPALERYNLLHTFDDIKDVGELTVKVFRAEGLLAKDIGGKSDPFAVLELVNARLQTHTEYRTLNPQWNALFTFCVKDIHTCLEVTVYDEDPNNKFEFLGKVIRNGERRWYGLKNKKLNTPVRGEIMLELNVTWNPVGILIFHPFTNFLIPYMITLEVRAALRTFQPRERKFLELDKKFKVSRE